MRALHTLALLLASCATTPGDDPDAATLPPGTLLLGEGERDFRAIEDGDTLLIARGCQGSQHVWMTLRSEDMDPRGMVVELAIVRADDDTLVSSPFRLRLSFTPDGGGAFAQLTGLTLQIPEPDLAIGHDLVLRGRLEDRNAVEALAERSVRVEWGDEVCSSPPG